MKKIFFALMMFVLCVAGTAQGQSALDGFDPNANGTIRVVTVQPDGKILIGGEFTTVAPNGGATVTRKGIARLNPDGTLDTGFDPNADGYVYAIAVQPDGKILACGNFLNIGGLPRNGIARLNAVTGLADSFNANANAPVTSIALQADGKIVVAGGFATIGGQSRAGFARLDGATGLADSFDPSSNGFVFSVVVQPDGKILAAGFFGNIGGQTRNNIARLDPATGLADSFNPNASFIVNSIVVQPDGKILAGGDFTSIGGQAHNRFARIDPITGLVDTSFDPNADGPPYSIAVQQDGKILAVGAFTTLAPSSGAQVPRSHIARLEKDGRLDQTLDDIYTNGTITVTAVQPDGKILIGGNFTSILFQARSYFARLNTDGTLDTTFNPNANNQVNIIIVQTDGKILVGGDFSNIGAQVRNKIARLDGTTGLADSFNPNPNNFVEAMAMQMDGRIIVGGQFNSIGGQTRFHLARLDPITGLADSFDPSISDPMGRVVTIAVQSDGKILAGGIFTTIGGQTRNFIARLDPTTGMPDSFNPNPNSYVVGSFLQANGNILLGGYFGIIAGQTRNRIARLDPTSGAADSFNPNANEFVYSFAGQTDGKVIVRGGFATIGGQARNQIARLDPTGLADTFNANAINNVSWIAVQPDGKILVGGNFQGGIGGQVRGGLARLTNNTPAMQNLSVTQTAVVWARGGSSPLLNRVSFESSTDGVNYSYLGNGTLSGSNWTLTGINLSTQQNLYVRARGFYGSNGADNGSESIEESVRNVFLSPAVTISGTVRYGNAIGAPTPRFVSNVTITGAGSPNVATTTAAPGATAGQYTLTGFGSGSYTVTPTKVGGVNGISSFDAGKIALHVAGTSTLTGNALIVADVSGNGIVSSFDAAQIAQFVTNGNGMQTGMWKFIPVSKSYASVTSNISGEDFIALLMGEVSGNWANTGARPVDGKR